MTPPSPASTSAGRNRPDFGRLYPYGREQAAPPILAPARNPCARAEPLRPRGTLAQARTPFARARPRPPDPAPREFGSQPPA